MERGRAWNVLLSCCPKEDVVLMEKVFPEPDLHFLSECILPPGLVRVGTG